MQLADISFYIFATIVVSAALLVVVSRNPVHSVLWLILMFLTSAGLFVLLGAEFVAMLLVIVYVGAVAVLFLFVVMMLDIDFSKLKSEFARYMPVAGLICVVLLMELSLIFGIWQTAETVQQARAALTPDPSSTHNTIALGKIIYSQYIYLFQIAGLILLVAMIGAIVLTIRHRPDVKRQDVLKQIYRDPSEQLEIKDVESGKGIQ
jgi:NADH-quinone oxidoreductase subunit J|tara:strand:- start:1940 stop:2557 length:618 start_codon:yes stop_codon:yes gene_type:complete